MAKRCSHCWEYIDSETEPYHACKNTHDGSVFYLHDEWCFSRFFCENEVDAIHEMHYAMMRGAYHL